ncbi:MAG TPA: glycosyltransferase [Candidatus Bathyarchaeia archaeon]|nr:glycosyltransferase [Candidatus Bathyarchaeia archaeon]
MRVVNLLATYNEKDNVGLMIEVLDKIAKKLPQYDFSTLVVDSHSPDGTAAIVKNLAKDRKDLFCLEAPRGLGVSLIQGYQYAMKALKADVVIPNDADFQWDPDYIPDLLAKIEKGYDVAVPSRHVPGGRDNFSPFRKLTHWVSNTLLAYYWAGIHEVKDHNGNMKAIRVKKILDQVDLKKLNVKGFVIQMTMIYELSKAGAKFCEIPAIYKDRRAGQAKVGFNLQFIKDILEYIKQATKIRIERSQRFVKFGVVGFIGYLVNASGLELFYRLGLSPGIAAAFGAELAIISNFTLNNLWTFSKEKISGPGKLVAKFLQFNFTSLGAVLIQGAVVGGLAYFFGEQWRQFYLVAAIGFFVLPYNYLMYTRVIWRVS